MACKLRVKHYCFYNLFTSCRSLTIEEQVSWCLLHQVTNRWFNAKSLYGAHKLQTCMQYHQHRGDLPPRPVHCRRSSIPKLGPKLSNTRRVSQSSDQLSCLRFATPIRGHNLFWVLPFANVPAFTSSSQHKTGICVF